MKKEVKKSKSEKIKNYRKKYGYSLKKLSTLSGVSVSHINYIETGKNSLTKRSILLLAKGFDITPEELVGPDFLPEGEVFGAIEPRKPRGAKIIREISLAAKRLQNYRKQKGFSQKRLSELSALPESMISNLGSGNSKIEKKHAVSIAPALGIHPAELLLPEFPVPEGGYESFALYGEDGKLLTLPQALRFYRDIPGYSQMTLGKLTGVSCGTIASIERRKSNLLKEPAIRLAKVLEIHPGYLLFSDYVVPK